MIFRVLYACPIVVFLPLLSCECAKCEVDMEKSSGCQLEPRDYNSTTTHLLVGTCQYMYIAEET